MIPPKTPSSDSDSTRLAERIDREPGRYLTAMYWLGTERDQQRITTGGLSDHLNVSPASVTEMIGKLARVGLVDYEEYRGSELTEHGETIARDLAWRQCIVRTFFASKLEYELDADTSYRIGYSLPASAVEGLREFVEHPPNDCCQVGACWHDYCLYGRRAIS